ncbi:MULTISPECIES: TetR/AcrR family transcriptional regulator [unclassified Bosea (in: a-proteobacteria)]|uniref:TetR/AcrR family transcriptional regulator n=1 Tax=unclassified Bosea (in: a-proteobacteria) TaxID=2653178 RepID=UPI001F387D2A|nr:MULTISPECIES: TetR/AcrR family transcriptional regulator [unclassified Bosea (in: a-proteobacteria)]
MRAAAYHHGNLREVLIAQALALAAEGGLEAVSIREVARRAGVSPAAPFRHFPDKVALMTAVAEEAMARFRAEIAAALAREVSDDPIRRIRAIGTAFLDWARRNPTHFEIISSRRAIDFAGSASLGADNAEIQAQMVTLLQEAARRGLLRVEEPHLIQITGRALVYGLARMLIDGQFPSWGVAEAEAEGLMERSLDLFLAGLLKNPATGDPGRS